MGMGLHTLPRLGFGTGMENNYIFWDENGIGVPRPKLAPLSFLDKLGVNGYKMVIE